MSHSIVLPLASFGFPRRPFPLPDVCLRFLPAPKNISSYWGPVRDAGNASIHYRVVADAYLYLYFGPCLFLRVSAVPYVLPF
eukprot:768239-Pyramimonas_sp.AAC.1